MQRIKIASNFGFLDKDVEYTKNFDKGVEVKFRGRTTKKDVMNATGAKEYMIDDLGDGTFFIHQ